MYVEITVVSVGYTVIANVNIMSFQKSVDKTKRWFSAISTPGRNYAVPRPVTSVSAHVGTSVNSLNSFRL